MFRNDGDVDEKITVQSYKDKYSATWTKIIDNSITAWNDSSVNVKISVSAKSKHVIKVKRYNDTWYGLMTQPHNTSRYTSKFIMEFYNVKGEKMYEKSDKEVTYSYS